MKKNILTIFFIILNFTTFSQSIIKINEGQEYKVFEKLQDFAKSPNTEILQFQFAKGNYFFPEGIKIEGLSNIEFIGNGDANLFAGKEISDFTKEGNIHKTEVKEDRKILNFLKINKNGEVQDYRIARLPDQGYFNVDKKAAEQTKSFHVKPEVMQLLDEDCSFTIWPGADYWNWMTLASPVKSLDAKNNLVKGELETRYYYDKNIRFYITGSKKFLTQKGEFFHDVVDGIFYYIAKDEEPAEVAIVATSKYLFHIKGSLEKPAENIRIKGLNLLLSNYTDSLAMADYDSWEEKNAMLIFESVINSEIADCVIKNAGFSAISLIEGSQNIVVNNNEIAYAGYNGVFALGPAVDDVRFTTPEEAYINKFHKITNNLIYSCGKNVGHASGVQLYQSGDNLIEHNTIYDMPRYGVSYKGESAWGDKGKLRTGAEIYGIKIDINEKHRFLHTRNNVLRYNDISQCMTDSQDGGLFEAWGTGRDNIIDNNFFHNTKIGIKNGLLLGIYIDDGSDFYTITNNVVEGLKGTQTYPIYLKGIGHKVQNNFVINCDAKANIAMWAMDRIRNDNIVMSHNVFYQLGIKTQYQYSDWTKDKIIYCDKNVYYNGSTDRRSYKVTGIPGAQSYWWWQKINSQKYDQESLIADPGFDLSEKKLYKFYKNSPALELGIKPIDLGEAGRR